MSDGKTGIRPSYGGIKHAVSSIGMFLVLCETVPGVAREKKNIGFVKKKKKLNYIFQNYVVIQCDPKVFAIYIFCPCVKTVLLTK